MRYPSHIRYSDLVKNPQVVSQNPVAQVVPPLEAYVEGPPPEVGAKPLREETLPLKIRASELAPIIERLKTDTVEWTQLRVDFGEEVGWVVPDPRYTLFFRKPEKRVVGKLVGARTPEELREYHKTLEGRYLGQTIEHHYRPDLNAHFFWAVPPERRHIRRSDPYLMAREVVNLSPKRLAIQTVPHIIRPPRPIPPSALPWRLRVLPPPRYPI